MAYTCDRQPNKHRMNSPRAAFLGTAGLLGLALGTGATLAAAQGAYPHRAIRMVVDTSPGGLTDILGRLAAEDRKSTRLNSSHLGISYAVFCLKKKRKKQTELR